MLNPEDRLTIPHAGHERKHTQYGYTAYWTQASKFDMMNRLGEYEDTGLSPADIRQLIDTVKGLGDINAVAVGDGQFDVNGYGMDDYIAILMGFKKLPIQEG